MHFDFWGRLGYPYRRILVEVALHRAAVVDGDFVAHHVTQAFDDSALTFVDGPARIDDLAADIADYPHFVDANLIAGRDAHLGHFREVPAMAEVEAHAKGGILGQLALAPPGFLRDHLEHAAHALRVQHRRTPLRRISRSRRPDRLRIHQPHP